MARPRPTKLLVALVLVIAGCDPFSEDTIGEPPPPFDAAPQPEPGPTPSPSPTPPSDGPAASPADALAPPSGCTLTRAGATGNEPGG